MQRLYMRTMDSLILLDERNAATYFRCYAPTNIAGATHLQKNFWSMLIDSSATHLHLQIFSVLRTLQGIWPNGQASIREPISGATHLFILLASGIRLLASGCWHLAVGGFSSGVGILFKIQEFKIGKAHNG